MGRRRLSAVKSSPLSYPVFRALWLSAIATFIGSFVQNVAEAWLMLDLTKSPLPVAMLSTAFVVASLVMMLPAGVLADRRDRRSILIASQIIQATVAVGLAALAYTHHITPEALIAGVALLGLGMALGVPGWTSLVPDLVPRELVAEAVALNAVSFNIARAVGPAIGGFVLARFGVTTSFLLNAASFLIVIASLLIYAKSDDETRPPPPKTPLAEAFTEPFPVLTGNAAVRSPTAAMCGFTLGAGIFYPLAPSFAKTVLGASAMEFGLMVGAMGAGAVLGASILKRLRKRLHPRLLLTLTMTTFALSAAAISRVSSMVAAMALFLPAGIGWMGSFSSLSALVQVWAPTRVRARFVALYTMIHLAMWAAASSIGGSMAERFGVRVAMLAGAIVCAIGASITWRLGLPKNFTGEPA
ncbi:MAG: MFS transporter [Labilithrix sp.]|nr:MFS transporter [Labilithrix sp.]